MDDPTNPDGLSDEQMLNFYDGLVDAMTELAHDAVHEPADDQEADQAYNIAVELGATARRMRDYYLRRIVLGAEPGKAVRPERSEPEAWA